MTNLLMVGDETVITNEHSSKGALLQHSHSVQAICH